MAVNRQDPDFLSSQVDSAAESMRQTEKAVSELQHLTGLADQLEEPPAILETDLRRCCAMTPESVTGAGLTTVQRRRDAADLPYLVSAWATRLAELYFSGTTAAFVLHGNTYDLFRVDRRPRPAIRRASPSSSPSSCSAAGRWSSTTTWAAACARSPGATSSA